MKKRFTYKIVFWSWIGILLFLILILLTSCEKADADYDNQSALKCGDSLTWIYYNDLQYTQIIIEIMPMNSSQADPNTTLWWNEQGTYKTTSYDGGGEDSECYLFKKYVAYALIDGGDPFTIGDFVFYEEGQIRMVNVLDGISWN